MMPRSDRPSTCDKCSDLFLDRPLLIAEISHIAVTDGPAAAEMDLNEKLADEHEAHVGGDV